MSSLIDFLSYFFLFIFVFLCDKNMREKEGLHEWFEVPKSLDKIFQSRDQRLMSCREKDKREDYLLLLFFPFILISLCFISFYMIKNLKEKEG